MNFKKSEARDAEVSIIGSIMLDNGAIDRVATLTPDHFTAASHRLIFAQMQSLAAADMPIDAVIMAEAMERAGTLAAAGGIDYLLQIDCAVGSAINIQHHARIVREYATIRQLVAELSRAHLAASSGDYDSAAELIGATGDAIIELTQDRSAGSAVMLRDAMREAVGQVKAAFENPGALTGLSVGFDSIDALTNGLEGGQLMIIAARPAMGKSALAQNIATNVARAGLTVAKFDLEMSAVESAKRVLASEARVDGRRMKSGTLETGEIDRILQAVKSNGALPLMIDDTSSVSVAHIRGACRQIAADRSTPPLGLVIIDYLQLMTGDRRGNREQEVSGIARGLKALSKSLGVPVIALSQCSRKCEDRVNKRPQLSDLRESGAIEQDADIVAFVYRDDYYEEDSDAAGEAEVIFAKNRSGDTGTARLKFVKEWTRFLDIDGGT